MRTRMLSAVLVVLAMAGAGGLSFAQDSPPHKGEKVSPPPQTAPGQPMPTAGQSGAPGALDAVDSTSVTARIDSAMVWMKRLTVQSKALSRSFGDLASLHEGADRSEILMMQRMADAMGTMAGELQTSYKQYHKMLTDETATESGDMKAEAHALRVVMDGIARQIDAAIQMLQTLQVGLGQG